MSECVCVCVCVCMCVCVSACAQPVLEEIWRRAIAHSNAIAGETIKKWVKSSGSNYLAKSILDLLCGWDLRSPDGKNKLI